MRLQTIIIAAVMTGGCAANQPSLLGHNAPNRGIPVIEKSTHITKPVVMRGGEIVSGTNSQAQDAAYAQEAQVFVPPPQSSSASFSVIEQTGQLSEAELRAPAPGKQIPAPAPAVQAPTFTSAITENRPAAPASKPISPADKAEIDRLTLKYAEGDVKSAYKLAQLLYKAQRNEEGDVVVDFAARNNNVPAMLLYSERLLQQGDLMNSNKWLEIAAEAGSPQAKAKLGEGSHVN